MNTTFKAMLAEDRFVTVQRLGVKDRSPEAYQRKATARHKRAQNSLYFTYQLVL